MPIPYRTSGGKGIYANWTTARPRKNLMQPSSALMQSYSNTASINKEDIGGVGSGETVPLPRIQKAALYIFGEKSQIKVCTGCLSVKI